MEKVNYIIQLNGAFNRFNNDDRIKQGHITLYLAFFQKWNREFFKKTITINREWIMEKAKFKSKTTYHNYLKNLNDWGYLQYYPSYHPARGSKVKMFIFFNSVGHNMAMHVPEPNQNLVLSYKHKTNKNLNKLAKPKNELEVLHFFIKNHWSAIEGEKFYMYYNAKNWELSRGLKITNWKEAASNYVEKGLKIKQEDTSSISDQHDMLRKYDDRNKDYGMPL